MSELENNYQKFTNEELLKRRALGEDGLSKEAHKVIEKILNERGVKYQAIPKKAVENSSIKENKKSKTGFIVAIVLGFVLIQTFVGNQYKHQIAFGYIAVIALFLLVKKMASKKDESQVGNDGFTELMKCCVEGDLKRVEEILNYSDQLNAVDGKGTTALMYAIANKHNDIARLLIMRGADKSIKTNSGKTAIYFAEKFNNKEIIKLL
jgi:Asp-tRNA(Asn)/Glu-tRNA(Gln) amidotransferase C subunit